MNTLRDRIIRRIVAQHPVTYEKLKSLVLGIGHTEIEFMEALESVHRDKRVVQTTVGDTIQYRPYVAPLVKEHFVREASHIHLWMIRTTQTIQRSQTLITVTYS